MNNTQGTPENNATSTSQKNSAVSLAGLDNLPGEGQATPREEAPVRDEPSGAGTRGTPGNNAASASPKNSAVSLAGLDDQPGESRAASGEEAPVRDEPSGVPTGPYASLTDLGAALRAGREARSLTREQIGDVLKLSVAHITALEEGQLEKIPHAAYARGFLRSYANFLKIPAGDYAALLGHITPPPPVERSVYSPDRSARPRRRSPLVGILVSLVIASVIGFAVWHFRLLDLVISESDPEPQTMAPMQSSETPLIGAGTTGRVQQPAGGNPNASGLENLPSGMQAPAQATPGMPSGAGSSSSAGSPSNTLAPGDPVNNREPLPAVVSPNSPWGILQGNATLAGEAGLADTRPGQAASSNPNLPATADMLPADGKHVVALVAEERCWIQVTADSGRPVQRTLEPGETFSVPFETGLVVRLGNAGGVRIFYDGVEDTDRGKKGQVRTLKYPRQGR